MRFGPTSKTSSRAPFLSPPVTAVIIVSSAPDTTHPRSVPSTTNINIATATITTVVVIAPETQRSVPTTSAVTSQTTPISSSTALSMASSSATDGGLDHRNLVIILAVVLTLVGLSLLLILIVFLRRCHGSRASFSRRGVSPIDDEEIATWRTNPQAMAESRPSSSHPPLRRTSSSIIIQHTPGWTETFDSQPSSAGSTPQGMVKNLPDLPPVARAPNSRSGLTDETIPGAQPFVTPPTRRSRRLSKTQSSGHIRNKSTRSSISISGADEKPRTSTNSRTVQNSCACAGERRVTPPGEKRVTPPSCSGDGTDVPLGGLSPPPRPAYLQQRF